VETFDINVGGVVMQVYPKEDETFEIRHNFRVIGILDPNIDNCYVQWTTTDPIEAEFVKKVGEQIERHYC
jgi:hypothetical protein